MLQKAVIFDMDGLLVDSEPFWQEAGMEALSRFGVRLSNRQYQSALGLRTPEWIDHWFTQFNIDPVHAPQAIRDIEASGLEKIRRNAQPMPGVEHIINFFIRRNFKIGLASSSPRIIINAVVEKLGIAPYLQAISSAGELDFGKPHPQVFLHCAEQLQTPAFHCVCFEDSFNGMIAAKAAKMKCVVVPHHEQYALPHWGAADLKLRSLANFNELLLEGLWELRE